MISIDKVKSGAIEAKDGLKTLTLGDWGSIASLVALGVWAIDTIRKHKKR